MPPTMHPYNREHGEMEEHPKCTRCDTLRYPLQEGIIIQGKYICVTCWNNRLQL